MDGASRGPRGRGRGRVTTEESPVYETAPAPDAQNVAASPLSGGVQFPPPPNLDDISTDRGRSRGRGAGRGRGADTRSPPLHASPEPQPLAPEVMEALAEQFADLPSPPRRPQLGEQAQEPPADAEMQDEENQPSPERVGVDEPAEAGGQGSPENVVVGEPGDVGEERSPQSVVEHPAEIGDIPGGVDGVGGDGDSSLRMSGSSVRRARDITEEPPVKRHGCKGDAVDLKTNYLRLLMKQGCYGLVEYHVSMDPAPDDVRLRRRVMNTEACRRAVGEVRNFDGMVLFLPIILKNDVTVVNTSLESEPDTTIRVTITFVKVKPMADAVVFFNILMHKVMRIVNFKELRREFYDENMKQVLDQHRLVVWPGYAVATEHQEDGLMVCVDTCNRVLRRESLYETWRSLRPDPEGRRKFENFVLGKIVITKYNTMSYKIDEVDWNMRPDSTFKYRGNEVTFTDYLRTKYPLMEENIVDFNQPMLLSKLKPRRNDKFQDEVKMAALIPQACYLTGLTEDQKQNFKVMTDLAASTRHVPIVRVQNLQTLINRLLSNEEVKQLLAGWGLTLERSVIEVQGRRVDGPDLTFNQRLQLKKAPPDFSRESGRGVYDPIAVRNYIIICTKRDEDKARRFMDCYKELAGPLGIKMMEPGAVQTLPGMRPTDFSDTLRKYAIPAKVHFVVIIMPMQKDDVYAAIKRYCISQTAIPSQCIVSKTLGNEKRMRSIVLKIALQINCKLGGSLWALKIPMQEEIMFIGIDAAHDPLKKDPSVICLVATMNNACTKYFSVSHTSKVHQELADSLEKLTKNALIHYQQERGRFPDRVIVFRDGGSMGALEIIGTTEVDLMKRAVDSTSGEKVKHFTFLVVTKRIPQRFFYKAGRDKLDNPPPGTVVDNMVTRRHIYDFYIISQQVRQGTVNPTHFVVVNTEDPIRPDLIQKLSYVTCFMYFNWSGTVRVPAMVQYAHKMSAMLSRHVKAPPLPGISNLLYYL